MGKISDALEKAGFEEEKSKDIQPESLLAKTPQEETPQGETPQKETVQEAGLQKETLQEESPSSETQEFPKLSDLNEKDNLSLGKTWDQRLFKAVKDDEYLPEIFKTIRSRVLIPGDGQRAPKTIMVTSAEPKEGKSFITANLGISLAQGVDQHCLMVSCDLRRPTLSSLFGLSNDDGLVDYLRDKKDLGSLIQKTSVEKLSIISSGKPPANPAELLGSSRMRGLVEELSRRYEDRIVIFDTPPYMLAAESEVLAKLVDSILLVVRQGGGSRHQVKKLLEKIGQDRLLGIVFNGHTTNVIERSLMKAYSSYTPQNYN